MKWLALDIGGANLKVADGLGYAASYSFALWKDSNLLTRELRKAIAESPPSDRLAVTMTGELADCFETKVEGVQFILQAFSDATDGRHGRVYLSNGALVTPQVALSDPLRAAAANWHVLARFAARFAPSGPALLIDVGSTTCDVIPLFDGQPQAAGTTDTERLLAGELVYTGVERSPVCALLHATPYRGQTCPIAQEVFATTRDVYLILGKIKEDDSMTTTADGRPATKAAARVRLARTICADLEQFNSRDAAVIAEAAAIAQRRLLSQAIEKVATRLPAPPSTVILSGHGEFLAKRVIRQLKATAEVVSLDKQLGSAVSRCAPAHALAVLAREASER